MSYYDGSHYQGNQLLSDKGQKLSIILYVDDFEIANPLGTSFSPTFDSAGPFVQLKRCTTVWI